jgi:predicted Zn-dependent peptidase
MFDDLAREGPTLEELQKVRRRIAWDVRALADSAEEMSAFHAGDILFDRFTTPEQHVAELVRVTPEQVRDVARLIARPERLNVVAVGLLEGDEEERLREAVQGWSGAH